MLPHVLVHFLTFNSSRAVLSAIDSLLRQEGFELGRNLTVQVTDNASTNGIAEEIGRHFADRVIVRKNAANLGFAAGQNLGAACFLRSTAEFFLIVNPDLRLEASALAELVTVLAGGAHVGSATPLLFRADEQLNALEPRVVDAAGMYMTPELRHLDRGSGGRDCPEYHERRLVFGASGACALYSRAFVEAMLIAAPSHEEDVDRIYPQLREGRTERAQFFDEAFFAYREDADLSWRAQLLGWKCVYVPTAVGYHVRKVVPERRATLPAELNRNSVRNRFLLQLNNFSWRINWRTILPGLCWRNLLVIAAVVLRERSSIPGLVDVVRLARRAFERRRIVFGRRETAPADSWRWFCWTPYTESPD